MNARTKLIVKSTLFMPNTRCRWASAAVARWQAALNNVKKGTPAYRNAKNNSARQSYGGWKERKEDYEEMEKGFSSR
jgi:hypothetical protein